MSTYRFAGAFNAFVAEATGQVISYIRDPGNYRLNDYVQYVPTETPIGLFYSLQVDDVARFLNDEEHVWADGAERPDPGRGEQIRFIPTEFQAIRKDFGFRMGWIAMQMAARSNLQLLTAHSQFARNQAMIDRTYRVITLLETSGSWPSTNTAAANTLNGGASFWDYATADYANANFLAIKKTLDEVERRITLKTNGAVKKEDLRLVLSPTAALRVSQTDEIHNYLKESVFALAQIRGDTPGQNAKWGLPDKLYGWNITVEDASRVNARPKADGSEESISSGGNKAFIKGDSTAIVVSRVGGLDGLAGAPSFSTVQMYVYGGEMQMQVFDDTKNERTEGHVVIHDKEVLAAGASGFLITSLFSS